MTKSNFKKWLKAAGIRAIKTVVQTAVATIGTLAAMGDVNGVMVASASALAGVLSLLTSVAGLPEVEDGAMVTCKNIAALGFNDRGIKDGSSLYVLRHTSARAMLIKELWTGYCGSDVNVYWFCRNLCQYVRTKPTGETADREYEDIGEIIWDLHHREIITDAALWTAYMKRDDNMYWFLRKGLHWCRTH